MTLLRMMIALVAALIDRLPAWIDELLARANIFALSFVCGVVLLAIAFSFTVCLVFGSLKRK
jgi:hypothetical protein